MSIHILGERLTPDGPAQSSPGSNHSRAFTRTRTHCQISWCIGNSRLSPTSRPTLPICLTECDQSRNKAPWKDAFKDAVKAGRLPTSVVTYALRHTMICEMIASGIDSYEVARMTETSTEMIDKRYGHLRHDRTQAKLDAMAIVQPPS